MAVAVPQGFSLRNLLLNGMKENMKLDKVLFRRRDANIKGVFSNVTYSRNLYSHLTFEKFFDCLDQQ
jgi:hypothetical protein